MTDYDPGVILVDKPAGRTSFAMVRAVRKACGVKKVGHAGTLDPFATGLLVICIGRPATRLIDGLMGGDKEYLATMVLGKISTTLDPEGDISEGGPVPVLDDCTVEDVLAKFRGAIMQTVPQYSAVKHKGKPLYHYARKGIHVEKEPRQVHVHTLERVQSETEATGDAAVLDLRIVCSKGTYIRSLAADIGAELGCGAYLSALRRTRSGFFDVSGALHGDVLYETNSAEQVRRQMITVPQVEKYLQLS